MHRLLEHGQTFFHGDLPEGLAEFRERVTTPNVVYQDVEPALLLPLNARRELLYVAFFGVVAAHRDAFAATRSHHLGCLVNSLGAALGGRLAAHAASRAVDRSSGFAQGTGNAAPGAARGAGNKCNTTFERFHARRCYTRLRSSSSEATSANNAVRTPEFRAWNPAADR